MKRICCPHCQAEFTDAEVLSIRQRWASGQRKTKSGGKNGGRPKVVQVARNGWDQSTNSPASQPVRERTYAPLED